MRHLLLPLALIGGCYSPTVVSKQYQCDQMNGRCPQGFSCFCGQCIRDGEQFDECIMNPDLLLSFSDGGTDPVCSISGGVAPVAGDAAKGLAFCPAAWRVPGVSLSDSPDSIAPKCNRKPSALGRGTDGVTDCSVEDNCAAGWHVCRGEGDLFTHNLGVVLCDAPGLLGLYISRQSGMPTGQAPRCGVGTAGLIGCGHVLGSAPANFCGVETRVLALDRLRPGMDSCAIDTNGTWHCGTTQDQEGKFVTKNTSDVGGVLCCRDP